MHNNKDTGLIESNETVLRADLMNPPQLTPTGKISHAKTRVYTQRYRKAWEQMPDFKGWLTSVPHQPTRAFCTYCRKNLHAHRLSLLKHTCTMKHQRGALMHQKETMARAAAAVTDKKISQDDIEMQDETDDIDEDPEEFKLETEDCEEEDEDIEYVVERLDDDDELEDDQCIKDMEADEYIEDEEEENLPVTKKSKTDDDDSMNHRPDTLAEAMAHVHGEYVDENGDSVNVELEMVVESVDPNEQEIRIVSVRSDRDEEEDNEITIESFDNEENSIDYATHDNEKETVTHENAGTASSCKSSMGGESSDIASETDEPERDEQLVHRTPLSMPATRRDYLTKPSTARSVSVLPMNSGSNVSPLTNTKKTITLTSGGKTVTLNTSSITQFPSGSRYILNSKGQASTIVVNEKGNQAMKNDEQQNTNQQILTAGATAYSTPGTSHSTPKKHIILKSVKPLVAKKPCISTHVLDTSKGLPVGGLQISLYKLMDGRWTFLNESNTTADGRCGDLIDTSKYTFTAGRYKLHFDVDKYFTLRRIETMYPFIEIIFDVKNPTEHYHVPVLISPFGYTTYRGS